MNVFVALLAFVPAVFMVIIIHEFGHYTVARLCGVRVLRFSLGIGKILYSRKFNPEGTEWALSLLPLGGYIKLLDARSEDMTKYPPDVMAHEFASRKVWQRILIAVAGPVANFLLAIILSTSIYVYGVQHPVAQLRTVPVGTVAYHAGLRGREIVTAINGQAVRHWDQARMLFAKAILEDGHVIHLEWTSKNNIHHQADIDIGYLTVQDMKEDFLKHLGFMVAYQPAIVSELEINGLAEKAGLRQGDRILAVDGKEMVDALEVVEFIRESPDRLLRFDVERQGKPMILTIQSGHRMDNQFRKIGRIGVKMHVVPETVTVRHDIFPALGTSIIKTAETIWITIKSIGQMMTGALSIKNISGPVGIADYAGKTVRAGIIAYLRFIVFISISIGVMNLLPIPVLDGGLLLYYAVEIIKGNPVSEKATRIWTAVGVGLLGFLTIIAMFNDFGRLFSLSKMID